jgi:TatA/E family protein of Tat protein translocase
MFGLQPLHLIIIFIVGLLVFGPKRLPEVGRYVAKMLNELRATTQDFSQILQEEINRPIKQDVAPVEASEPLVNSEWQPVCKNCARPNPAEARFCGHCGTPIIKSEPTPQESVISDPHGSVPELFEEPANPIGSPSPEAEGIAAEPPESVWDSLQTLTETVDSAPSEVVLAEPHGSVDTPDEPAESIAPEAVSVESHESIPDTSQTLAEAVDSALPDAVLVGPDGSVIAPEEPAEATPSTPQDEPEIITADAQNFCPKCATPNKSTANFCARCGEPLKKPDENESSNAIVNETTQ